MLNLAMLLEDNANKYPDHDAIVFGNTRLTYARLNAAACQVANGLVARGIGPGDNVALSCPNVPYFPIAYYGILKAGAAAVPLNVLLSSREIAYPSPTLTPKPISVSRALLGCLSTRRATRASSRLAPASSSFS
ncbi:MAG: AMP-binding protein [Ktedonobacterales bacterium]